MPMRFGRAAEAHRDGRRVATGDKGGSSRKLTALQAGRGIAALMVAVYHANNFVIPMRIPGGSPLWTGFGMGYAGVEFFFVLSGFIMMHVHGHEFGRSDRLGRFLTKRVTRIYPVYWIVLAGLVLLYQVDRTLGNEVVRSPSNIVASFLLFPWPDRPVLPVAWTLKHEVLFYAIFCLFFLGRRIGTTVFLIWMLACVTAMLWVPRNNLAGFFLSPYNILFLFGIAVGWGHTRLPTRAAPFAVVLGIAGFLFVGLTEQYVAAWPLGLRTMAYGVSAVVLVAGLVQGRLAVPRLAIFLGDASYAIYLVHLPAMNAVALVLVRFGWTGLIAPPVLFIGLVASATLAGVLFHLAVERPLVAHLARRGSNRVSNEVQAAQAVSLVR